MMNRWLVVALVCAGASVADAKNVRLDKDGLTAWVPDQWTVDTSTPDVVSAMAPNNAASCAFVSQPIRDLDLAYKSMPKVVGALVPGLTFGQAQRVNIANMPAIIIKGIADVQGQKIETNIATLITPGQRALYVITLVQAETAKTYDQAMRGILYGLKAAGAPVGGPAPAQPAPSPNNPCWEMKSQPNGWSRKEWRGLSFLLPQGWSYSEAKDPNTDSAYITITDRSSSIMVFTYAAARHDAAWQALGSQIAAYGLGDVAWGTVEGQRALCAKGSASDGVVFHRGQVALGMFGKAAGDPSLMRGILGSMRWR